MSAEYPPSAANEDGPDSRRDASGRFLAGHGFSKGNKTNARVAALRRAFLDCVSEERLRGDSRRVLLMANRQWGKSTATSLIALWTATFQPGSLVLLLSPSQRQSGELFRKVVGSYAALGKPVPAVAATKTALELTNGSR